MVRVVVPKKSMLLLSGLAVVAIVIILALLSLLAAFGLGII